MSSGDEPANGLLGGGRESAGGLSRLGVVAARTFDRKAAGLLRVASVATRGLLQQSGQRFGHRATRLQDRAQGNAFGVGIAVEDAGKEPGLAPESGVEAGRIDAERLREVGDADRVVAARVKQALGRGDGLLGIEAARATARTRLICSHEYKMP